MLRSVHLQMLTHMSMLTEKVKKLEAAVGGDGGGDGDGPQVQISACAAGQGQRGAGGAQDKEHVVKLNHVLAKTDHYDERLEHHQNKLSDLEALIRSQQEEIERLRRGKK